MKRNRKELLFGSVLSILYNTVMGLVGADFRPISLNTRKLLTCALCMAHNVSYYSMGG